MQINAQYLFLQNQQFQKIIEKYKKLIAEKDNRIKELEKTQEYMDQAIIYDYQLKAIMEGDHYLLKDLGFDFKQFTSMVYNDNDLDIEFKLDLMYSLINDSVYSEFRKKALS